MKRLYNLLLIFSLFVAISLSNTMIANAADYVSVGTVNNQSQFTIDTPYEYPVHPGMEEWEALDDHAKKIELCQIPEEILEKMTTEALAESVLNYPLLIDMYVWESNSKGYEFVSETFNGMYELRQRSDGLLVLQRLALNGYQESDDSSVSLKNMYLRTLVEKMSEENANLIVPYSSIEQKGDIQNQLLEAYPSTVIYQNVMNYYYFVMIPFYCLTIINLIVTVSVRDWKNVSKKFAVVQICVFLALASHFYFFGVLADNNIDIQNLTIQMLALVGFNLIWFITGFIRLIKNRNAVKN